jgi:hypothetical protein
MGESAQLRFALKNFGRNSPNLGEFRPLLSRRICWFGEISPKSKEIRPKFFGRNLTARVRPFRARKRITVYYLTFVEKTIFKIPKWRIFRSCHQWINDKKSISTAFFPPYSTFFKFSKSNPIVERPLIYQKKMPKKFFQDDEYFKNGVCTFFLYENMSCGRYFKSIGLFFGLSDYFLTFNHTRFFLIFGPP